MMRDRIKRAYVVAALLALALSATARAQVAVAPHTQGQEQGRQFYVRAVVYTAPPSQQIIGLPGPLEGGVRDWKGFEEELKKLEASGKVSVRSRPQAVVRAGATLELAAGAQIVPAVPERVRKNAGKYSGGLYSPVVTGSWLSVHVEDGGDGCAAWLGIDMQAQEPTADGGSVEREGLKTTIRLKAGEVYVFGFGSSPENNHQTFFAITALPVPEPEKDKAE
jgi:hypothetical protein